MSVEKQFNNSLFYLLIFTALSSIIAFYLVIHAYDGVFEASYSLNE